MRLAEYKRAALKLRRSVGEKREYVGQLREQLAREEAELAELAELERKLFDAEDCVVFATVINRKRGRTPMDATP